MSSIAYYLLWLAAGLAIVALISALIARRLRLRVMRRLKAAELLDALTRYSEWVAGQRRALLFQGDLHEDGSALQEVRAIGQQWFPDLSVPTEQVFAVHARLIEFLTTQQALRLQDPEAWLDSDHDARFQEQWCQHVWAMQLMAEGLVLASEPIESRRESGTTFPA